METYLPHLLPLLLSALGSAVGGFAVIRFVIHDHARRLHELEDFRNNATKDFVPRSEVMLAVQSLLGSVGHLNSLVASMVRDRVSTIVAAAEEPFQFDTNSEARLKPLQPELVVKIRAAAAELAASGIFFRVAQGLRTYAEQDELYEQGRTKPGPKVTNARGGWSNHNFGYAVDCYPFVHGDSGPLEMQNPALPVFQTMIRSMRNQGLVCGVDWHTMPDAPHFQLANMPVTPTEADREAYAHGGIEAVWALHGGSHDHAA